MPKLPRDATKEIRAFQDEAMRMIGADIDRFVNYNRALNISTKRILKKAIPIQEILENNFQEKNIVADDLIKNYQNLICVTHYDNLDLNLRYLNIIQYLRMYYDHESNDVFLSCMPFTGSNSITTKLNTDQYVIFLNHGILATLPILFEDLMPIIDSEMFGSPKPGFFGRIIGKILNLWCVSRSFQELGIEVERPGGRERFNGRMPSSLTGKYQFSQTLYDRQKALYFSIRGALVFILAHEFCHIRDNHFEATHAEQTLRKREEIERVYEILDRLGRSRKEAVREVNRNVNFLTQQPIEQMADVNALRCVAGYCRACDVSQNNTMAAIFGALGVLLLMEFRDRLLMMGMLGAEFLKKEHLLDDLFRDFAHANHHPFPKSRIKTLLECPLIGQLFGDAQFPRLLQHEYLNKIDIFTDEISKHDTALSTELKNLRSSFGAYKEIAIPGYAFASADFQNNLKMQFSH